MIRHFIRIVPCALVMACTGAQTGGFHEVGRFRAPNMHALYPDDTHFVVAPESVMRDRGAVLDYSRRACGGDAQVCFVIYWTDTANAANGFPIPERQANAMVASYSRNRSSGRDGLQCYNFGSPSESCSGHRPTP